MITFQCFVCGRTWKADLPDSGLPGRSHGLCAQHAKELLIPLYRKRQLREGNFDCFGKANGYCDQINCLYRNLCLAPPDAVVDYTPMLARVSLNKCNP